MVRRFPLLAYFVLAYALTWWVYPLLQVNPMIGLLGLFGPALAAILVTAITDGRPGVRALLTRVVRWRVPVRWYVFAIGLPTLLALLAAGLSAWFGPAVLQVGRVYGDRLRPGGAGARRGTRLARLRAAQAAASGSRRWSPA